MPDSICRRLTELRVQHERWAAPDSKASNGQIKDSRSILFLCQALEMAVDEVEKLKEENAELNGYAEAAQEAAKQRDTLRIEIEKLKDENVQLVEDVKRVTQLKENHSLDCEHLQLIKNDCVQQYLKAQAREVLYREALKDIDAGSGDALPG